MEIVLQVYWLVIRLTTMLQESKVKEQNDIEELCMLQKPIVKMKPLEAKLSCRSDTRKACWILLTGCEFCIVKRSNNSPTNNEWKMAAK